MNANKHWHQPLRELYFFFHHSIKPSYHSGYGKYDYQIIFVFQNHVTGHRDRAGTLRRGNCRARG
jgi:hypothetical protein